jgi:hypothetical protein
MFCRFLGDAKIVFPKNLILDSGYWRLDSGYLILDTGFWILDT